MKSSVFVSALAFLVFLFYACASSRSGNNFGEGGSSKDTLSISAQDTPSAFVFETLNAEGGSSRDTIYLEAKHPARFYKIGNYRKKGNP